MNYYWFSWEQIGYDYRPMNYPPNENILGWWCSGYTSDGVAILCAMVKASNEDEVIQKIFLDWPEVISSNIRFNNKKENLNMGDRFPLDDWMMERFENEKSSTSKNS